MDKSRVNEIRLALLQLRGRSNMLPEYICSSENYPIDNTTVIENVHPLFFQHLMTEAASIIERSI